MRAEEVLHEREAWLAGQRDALEAALNDAPLETSLGLLVRTATDRLGHGVRGAFYLANIEARTLHHVVGMPAGYAEAVDGFPIGPESLSCGLAVHTGQPVLTSDVANEPLWKPWLWLAEKFDFRGCWSFPIHTVRGRFVGTFAVYSRQPREATSWVLDLVSLITQAAAIIIARYTDTELRREAEETQQLLVKELNHRVKNTLAVVQAIANQTLADARDPAEFALSFNGRIQSLARVHALLSDRIWQGADLSELVRDQLLPGIADETRLIVRGAQVRLEPQAALLIAAMLHELGTNSSKHGALSVVGGWVAVNWTTGSKLHIHWEERGGPAVATPSRRGFGVTLVEQSAQGLGGDARMLCASDGISWDITLPLPEGTDFAAEPRTAPTSGSMAETLTAGKRSPSLAGRRFLVVEDEPLIGLEIAAALKGVQALVDGPVGRAAKALEIIERTSLDGALLDANLHGLPVDEIANALTLRNVPFVFVTGQGRDSLPEAFRRVPLLAKPCSRQQVIDAAAQMMKRPDVVRSNEFA
jgi:two-component sensor histidine kinase